MPAGSCSRLLEDARQACHRFRCSSAHQQAGQPASRACSSNSNRELCTQSRRPQLCTAAYTQHCKPSRQGGSISRTSAWGAAAAAGERSAALVFFFVWAAAGGKDRVRCCSSTGFCCCYFLPTYHTSIPPAQTNCLQALVQHATPMLLLPSCCQGSDKLLRFTAF